MLQLGRDSWPELFEYAVAEDGSFTVPEAPSNGGSVYLAANAPGLGEAQFMSTPANFAASAAVYSRVLKKGFGDRRLGMEGVD